MPIQSLTGESSRRTAGGFAATARALRRTLATGAAVAVVLHRGAVAVSSARPRPEREQQQRHNQQQHRQEDQQRPQTHRTLQDPNNNFCGASWGDASENCSERQHCPTASDEACAMPGHVCFADTLCDASKGDGTGGGALQLPGIGYLLPYDDRSNVMFCQNQWDPSDDCDLDLWCGDGKDCGADAICFYSDRCHLHDIAEKLAEEEAKKLAMEQKAMIASLDPNDPIRYNSCGKSWSDADKRCTKWCWGEESDCPPGEGCFGDTGCYNDAGLVPSPAPTTYPPTSRAPTVREDPSNYRFCGKSWDTAECSIAAHCPTGTECEDGEVCYTKQRCNVQDLTHPPTSSPSLSPTLPHDHASYYRYCGKSAQHAGDQCSLRTRCSVDDDCPSGARCFGDLPEKCNAFYFWNPHKRPTGRPTNRPTTPRPTAPSESPTPNPSESPTTRTPTVREDPVNTRFCGTRWDRVVCTVDNHCPIGTECKNGETCFTIYRCNIQDLTAFPTPEPTRFPVATPKPTDRPTTPRPTGPSRSPTPPPTTSPTTKAPTVRDDPVNLRFCGKTWSTVQCTRENHCPLGNECKNGYLCFTTTCNLQDLTDAPTDDPTTSPIVSTARPTTARPTGPSRAPTRMPTQFPTTRAPTTRDDPVNRRFCGSAWNSVACSLEKWCPTGTECTNGQICFSQHHGCNIKDMAAPTSPPLEEEEEEEEEEDSLPSPNPKFCGFDFLDAVWRCSLATRCAADGDCSNGDSCFENLPGHCNVFFQAEFPDLVAATTTPPPTTPPPTPRPTPPLRTRRPSPRPAAMVPKRTFRPSRSPSEPNNDEPYSWTPKRTFRPTRRPSATVEDEVPSPAAEDEKQPVEVEQRRSFWCGKTQSDANNNCGHNFFRCEESKCPIGWECFAVEDRLCKIAATAEKGATIESATLEEITIVSSRTRPPTPPPTPPPTKPTRRPTNIPTTKVPTPRPTTRKPTRKPVMNIPTKQTILKIVTDSPTRRPTSKPTTGIPAEQKTSKPIAVSWAMQPPPTRKPATNRPSERPPSRPMERLTSRPIANSPGKQPTPDKQATVHNLATPAVPVSTEVARSFSPTIVHYTIPTPSSSTTQSPIVRHTPVKITVPLEPTPQTNKLPNGENMKKPGSSPQLAAKADDVITGKGITDVEPDPSTAKNDSAAKENAEKEPTSAAEGLGTIDNAASNTQRKFYCLSQPSHFEEECVHATECGKGNLCPSGDHSCLPVICEKRPPSSSDDSTLDDDPCPFEFAGTLVSDDCRSYHECNVRGRAGPARTCDEGSKFDKSSGGCVPEFLVDSECYLLGKKSHVQSDNSSSDGSESNDGDSATTSSSSHSPASLTHANTNDPSEKNGPSSSSESLWWETPQNSPSSSHEEKEQDLESQWPRTSPDEERYDLSHWYTPPTNGNHGGEDWRLTRVRSRWRKIQATVQFIVLFSSCAML